jgi:ElaB/YqjD/DUF883 family membrane-anchored ribosome-binding protein
MPDEQLKGALIMPRSNERNGPEEHEDLKSKVAGVSDSVREVGGHLRDAAVEQYENVRDRAAGYVEAGRAKIEAGRAKAREMEEGVESYVQENPIQAVLIAAGVGMLIGLLWRRR